MGTCRRDGVDVRAQSRGSRGMDCRTKDIPGGPPGRREPVCNHTEANLRGWPSGIVKELRKIGPGTLVANKPLTDSKTKFLLVMSPYRVNYVFKNLS